LDLFKVLPDSRKQKGTGVMIKTAPKHAKPKLEKSMQAFPELEGLVVKSLARLKLIDVEEAKNGQGDATPPPAAA
jgi:hypothetical protein